jgi:hypothetical protein
MAGYNLKDILADFACTIFPEDANVPGLTEAASLL